MGKVPTSQAIMDVFNKNQDFKEVGAMFGWTPGYAEFMVAQAKKQVPAASPSPVKQATVTKAEEVVMTATILDKSLNEVKVPVSEVSMNKDIAPDAKSILTTKINAMDMLAEVLRGYVRRDVDNIVDTFSKLKRNICLVGDSGTGKTTLVEQYAATRNLPFLRVSCDETTSLKMLLGTKEIINGTTYFRTGVLLELIQMASVILFDEFNALHSSKLFFLHELLDNRRVFVQDADGGKVIRVHPECKIFLACNPANKNYGGTNKMNAALGNRTTVIDVPNIKIEEMEKLFECGADTDNLKQFYGEANRAIYDRNLRVAFSLRNIQRASEAIKAGVKPIDALKYDFYNAALLTASEVERDIFEGIALRIFGR